MFGILKIFGYPFVFGEFAHLSYSFIIFILNNNHISDFLLLECLLNPFLLPFLPWKPLLFVLENFLPPYFLFYFDYL